MKQNMKKLLSLLLVMTMLFGMLPTVFAEDAVEPEEEVQLAELPETVETAPGEAAEESETSESEEILLPPSAELTEAEEPAVETETPEEDHPAEEPETEANEVPPEEPLEPAEEPEAPSEAGEETVPAVLTEEEDGAEPTETSEEAEAPEEEDAEAAEESEEAEEDEAIELPYGFVGMGKSYVFSEKELAAKSAMAELAEALRGMTPGKDYVEGELLFLTESQAYAEQVAAAFNAELVYCDDFFAQIRLNEATVLQAVECAANPETPLPAVEVNWKAEESNIPGTAIELGDIDIQGERKTWENWELTDYWLKDPSSSYTYQYHHDILEDYAA